MKRLIITIAVCAAVLIGVAAIVNISRNSEVKIEQYDLVEILKYNIRLDNYKVGDFYGNGSCIDLYKKENKLKCVGKDTVKIFEGKQVWSYYTTSREGIIGEMSFESSVGGYQALCEDFLSYIENNKVDYTMQKDKLTDWIKVTFKHKETKEIANIYFNPQTLLIEYFDLGEEKILTEIQINCVTDEDMEIPSDIEFIEVKK
ncbi:MAG: hypothetical protein IKV94_03155 [Clostridia bacterium]|nr:hypothetical protein [Clostridia bacterium]